MLGFFTVIIIALIGIAHVDAACSVCNTHGVACISETEFRLCNRQIPDTTSKLTCPENFFCTDLSMVCVENGTSNVVKACEFSSKCDICEQDKPFACTSKTTFALCSAGKITSTVGTCPSGLYCDTTGTDTSISVCKEFCDVKYGFQCDRNAIVKATPENTSSNIRMHINLNLNISSNSNDTLITNNEMQEY